MLSLFGEPQAEIIETFNNSASRYLYDLLNIDDNYFDGMVNQIHPSELQLNKSKYPRYRGPVSGFTPDYFRCFCFC